MQWISLVAPSLVGWTIRSGAVGYLPTKHAKVHDLTIENVGTRRSGEATAVLSIRGCWRMGGDAGLHQQASGPGRPDLQDLLVIFGYQGCNPLYLVGFLDNLGRMGVLCPWNVSFFVVCRWEPPRWLGFWLWKDGAVGHIHRHEFRGTVAFLNENTWRGIVGEGNYDPIHFPAIITSHWVCHRYINLVPQPHLIFPTVEEKNVVRTTCWGKTLMGKSVAGTKQL